ncbi:hypothetical protein LTS18_002326, partial [Coniosporium uncinatum]
LTTYNRAAPTEPITIYDGVASDSSTYGSAVSYTGSITQAGGQSNPVSAGSGVSPTNANDANSAASNSGTPTASPAALSSGLSTDGKIGVGVGVGVGVPLLLAALGILLLLGAKASSTATGAAATISGEPSVCAQFIDADARVFCATSADTRLESAPYDKRVSPRGAAYVLAWQASLYADNIITATID